MLKRTIQFFLVITFTVFLHTNIGKADTSAEEKTILPKKLHGETKSKRNKIDEISDNHSEIDIKSTQQPAGPPYPFIYENTDKDQLDCKATIFIEPEYHNLKPQRKGNNLMRKPGSSVRAGGNYIQINGIITDENCLPIQGAVIEVWQTDALGRYEWEYDTKSYWEIRPHGKDNNFLFSGSAQTDNLGQFNILTIFPYSKSQDAPYINIIVKRSGYDELRTRMYFAGHPRNVSDKIFKSMNDVEKKSITAIGRNIDQNGRHEGRVYYFPITMTGISAYKRF